MKAYLNVFLDNWPTSVDDAILILQHFLKRATPWEHQRLIGESCNPTTPPKAMQLGGYGIYGPFPTAGEMTSRIRQNVLRAILQFPGLLATLPNGLYSKIVVPSRNGSAFAEIDAGRDAVAALHGARIPTSINRFHNAIVLAFPSLCISAKEVWVTCAVTTPGEFRRGKKGACAWWSCSSLTDQDNPAWRRTKETFPAFLHRAAEHFKTSRPR